VPVKIFFCYAHEDEALLNKLKTHLRPLQRQGLIDVWHDRDIRAGAVWEQEIRRRLNEADIILLLVSPSFMDSDYCYSIEMKRAIERHKKNEASVIPIILEYVYWQVEPLKNLQALPTDAKPIVSASWHSQNEALYNVTDGIRKVVMELTQQAARPVPIASIQSSKPVRAKVTSPKPRSATSVTRSKTQLLSPQPKRESIPSSINVLKREVAHTHSVVKPEEFTLLRTLRRHSGTVRSIAFSPDGQTLTSGRGDGTIRMCRLSTGKELHTFTFTFARHQDSLSTLAFSPDGQILVCGSGTGVIKLWNTSTGKELWTLTGHSASISSVTFSPDGQILASGSWDYIKLWNTSTGKELRTLTGHSDSVRSVAFSPDGQILVCGSGTGVIKLWNTSTGKELCILTGHKGDVSSVTFSPDGQILASGSWDNTIKLWNPKLGRELYTLTGHSGTVHCVAFSPDGQALASGSTDTTIKLWNTQTGRERCTLTKHSDRISSVAFSPDGQILASGSWDNTIKLWEKKSI